MKYHVEDSLSNFNFWSGGKDNADLLSSEQLDTVEQMLEDIEPEDGWSDTAINDMFWFDFNTICDWLGYKDGEHLEKGVSNDDIQGAEDWAEDMSTDYDSLFDVAGMKEEDYMCLNNDEEFEVDYDLATYDFMDWWGNLDDFAKMEVYNKHQLKEVS